MSDFVAAPVRAEIDAFDWVERLFRIGTKTCGGKLALFDMVRTYLAGRGVVVTSSPSEVSEIGCVTASIPVLARNIQGGLVLLGDTSANNVDGPKKMLDESRPLLRGGPLHGRGVGGMKGLLCLLLS